MVVGGQRRGRPAEAREPADLQLLQITRRAERGAAAGEERGTGVTIVTASAGNHGRAIAWAAEQLGIKAIVFTPRTAAETKTRAIVAHGADLRAVAANYEEAERLAQQHARDTGARVRFALQPPAM